MAIPYPPTLPCPLLGSSGQGSPTFDVTQFDYDIRHRKRTCGPYYFQASFIAEQDLNMKEWKDFYYTTLNRGMLSFEADWLVEGDSSIKEFRFSDIYSSVPLGNGKWRISANFEMITRIGEL